MDEQTSQALLEFSYHLAIGDTNEAYKVAPSCKLGLGSATRLRDVHVTSAFVCRMDLSGLKVSVDNMQSKCFCSLHTSCNASHFGSVRKASVHSEVRWTLMPPANAVACKQKAIACSYACLKNILDSMVTVCASVRQHLETTQLSAMCLSMSAVRLLLSAGFWLKMAHAC